MRKVLIFLSSAVLLGVLCPHPVLSQESSAGVVSTVSTNSPGILGGHEFVLSSYLPDPFVRTSLRTGLGFGMTPELVVPLVTINDTSYFGLKGSLLYALLDVEYQQRIRDWLALRGSVRVIGRMADETPTLISQGVTLFSIFELGWLIRFEESDRFLLSGSLGIRNSSMTDVYLQRFVEGIIENGGITPANRLVQTTPTLRGVAGLHGAYAMTDLVGLSFNGDLDYGESAERSSPAEWSYGLATAVDFNLLRPTGTPVGFLVGMEIRSSALGQTVHDESILTFFGRIGYTGSKEFSLGLDLGYQLTHVRGVEGRQGFMSALIDTRLYF